MKFEFDPAKFIELPNVFEGAALERLKKSLFALMLRQKDRIFKKGTDPDGTPWTPLSQGHAARREAKNRKDVDAVNKRRARAGKGRLKDHAILVDTGTLKNSLTTADSPYQVKSQQPFEVVLGTNVPYAAIHNDGGTIKRRTKNGSFTTVIPQRRFMGIGEEDAREIDEKVAAFIAKGGE